MSKLDTIMAELHECLAQQLLERVQGVDAKSADLNVARQFLKDNGIDGVLPDFDVEDLPLQ